MATMVVFKFRLTVVIDFLDNHDYHDYHGNCGNNTERFVFYLMHSIMQFPTCINQVIKLSFSALIRLLFFNLPV